MVCSVVCACICVARISLLASACVPWTCMCVHGVVVLRVERGAFRPKDRVQEARSAVIASSWLSRMEWMEW
jgi:hypothetical protein